MDTFKNKQYESYTYLSRYTTVPYYFDTLHQRSVYGIGSGLKKNTEYFTYRIKQSDTLDSLALKYYNNPTFWWVIAYFNNILDSLEPLAVGSTIKIPALSSISFGASR